MRKMESDTKKMNKKNKDINMSMPAIELLIETMIG